MQHATGGRCALHLTWCNLQRRTLVGLLPLPPLPATLGAAESPGILQEWASEASRALPAIEFRAVQVERPASVVIFGIRHDCPDAAAQVSEAIAALRP